MREDSACKILVAEDNLITQNLLGSILRHWGYLVTTVANGLEAIDQLKNQIFDVIILDYQMPKMNGLETFNVIEQNFQKTPVIILTGEISNSILSDIEKSGVKFLLKKPIQPSELSFMITQIIEGESNTRNKGVVSTKYLRRITNANNFLMVEILDVFLEETPKNFRKLKSYCVLEDWINFKKLLHKIKANHFYVGLKENERMIHNLEMDVERKIYRGTYLGRIIELEKNTNRAMIVLNMKRKILYEKTQDNNLP